MSNFVGCIEGRSAGALMLEAQRLHSPAVDCIIESPSPEPHIGLQRFEAGCNWKPAG